MTAAPHSCALNATAPGYSIPAAAFLRSPSFLPRAPRTRYLTHGLRRWAAAPAPRTGWPGIPAGITATRTLTEASIQEDRQRLQNAFPRRGSLSDRRWMGVQGRRLAGAYLPNSPTAAPLAMQPMKAAFWQDCGWHRSSAKRNPCSAKITRTGCCRRTVSPGAAAATGAAFMRWTSTTRRYRPTSSRSLTASCRIGALTLSSWTFSTAQHRSATPGNPAQDGCSAPWHCCAHGAATS